jgi:putative transcriptional regulator
MKSAFKELMKGLDDVESYLSGEAEGFRVHVPGQVDVKKIRTHLHMTQSKFSNTFGFSLDAVKHWEGGRRMPDPSARAYLTIIDKAPEVVINILGPGEARAQIASKKRASTSTRKGRTSKTRKMREAYAMA